jgi:hypothetical protein
MRLDPLAIVSLIAGAIPVGAVGAFFLYISPLTILLVATALIALLLLVGLKIAWGRRLRRSIRKPAPQVIVVPARVPVRAASEFL